MFALILTMCLCGAIANTASVRTLGFIQFDCQYKQNFEGFVARPEFQDTDIQLVALTNDVMGDNWEGPCRGIGVLNFGSNPTPSAFFMNHAHAPGYPTSNIITVNLTVTIGASKGALVFQDAKLLDPNDAALAAGGQRLVFADSDNWTHVHIAPDRAPLIRNGSTLIVTGIQRADRNESQQGGQAADSTDVITSKFDTRL